MEPNTESTLPEEKKAYTAEEIDALHKDGHHIGKPEQKLHATDGEENEPSSGTMKRVEHPKNDAEKKVQDAVKEALKPSAGK